MRDLIRLILREETIGDEQFRKPKGYWTYDRVKQEAEKYNTKVEFKNANVAAYQHAYRNKWLDDVTSHMKRPVSQRYYWTYDRVKQEAEKYNTKKEFQKGSSGAYNVAQANKWLDDITKHMELYVKPIYWTFDKVKQEAEKYNTKSEFSKVSPGAYASAQKFNWLDDVTNHMKPVKGFGYWTFDKVKQEAEKYNTKTEFQKGSSGAYIVAKKNNWFDDVTKHMGVVGNKFNRLIYSFEFPDKSVYVGLTYNEKVRYSEHMRNISSAVYKYIKETGLKPVFKKETHYLSQENAVRMEEYVEDWYRQNGWKILNVIKTGGLGGANIIWTFDKVKQEAEKYNTNIEFMRGSPGAYSSAKRNNWLGDITKHMESYVRPIYWTFDKVKQEAEKYNTKKEFLKGSPRAYGIAKVNKWVDDVTSHMEQLKVPANYWTFDKVKQEAEKYGTKVEFSKGNTSAYQAAYKNNWLDDVTKHMVKKETNPRGYWTYDMVKQEAEKYNTRTEFWKGSGSAYIVASKNNWLDDFFPKDQR